jgi:NADPH:quinone reductase-like Zn-dependent oxidoreductase/NAD(P)-dependent dehydrogenase (short-subunit alcohol dehydrogenase family)/SAM-dependent methyltransferase/acyl carrier protein
VSIRNPTGPAAGLADYKQAWSDYIVRYADLWLESIESQQVYRGDCLDLLAMVFAHRALSPLTAATAGEGSTLPHYAGFVARFREHAGRFDHRAAVTALGFDERRDWRGIDPDLVASRLLMLMPHASVEITLIQRIGNALPAILTGSCTFMDAICPANDTSMLEALYFGSSSAILFNIVFAGTFEAILQAKRRPLRVLEIGAGTGGSTAAIMHLIGRGCTEYWFTDVSNGLLSVARRRFTGAAFRFEILDVDDVNAFAALEDKPFDVVIAVNALHYAVSLPAAIGNVSRIIADDGCLLLSESDRMPLWTEFIFSAEPGWWNACDNTNRSIGPLIAAVIGESFAAISTEFMPFSDPGYIRNFPQIIVARKSPRPQTAEASGPPAGLVALQSPDRLQSAPKAAGDDCSRPPKALNLILVTTALDAGSAVIDLGAELDPSQSIVVGDQPGIGTAFLSEHPGQCFEFCLLLDHAAISAALLGEDSESGDRIARALLDQWFGVLGFIREVLGDVTEHRLSVVSLGGQKIKDEEPNVALAGYHGLFSTVAVEYPRTALRSFDADPALRGAALARSIRVFLDREFRRDEVAERDGVLLTPVLTATSLIRPKPQLPSLLGAAAKRGTDSANVPSYRVGIGRVRDFDDLDYVSVVPRPLGSNEVEVAVHYSALNYRDVLKVLGEYPLDGGDYMNIGDECSGIVQAVGSQVDPALVGTRVMALGANLLASRAIVDARQVMPVPDNMALNEAATMPVAYLTAHYSLLVIGRLRAGERVLIHAAAGGVGLAAIKVAKAIGAEVFATASLAKQATVKLWGADHVFDSRSLAFEGAIQALTGGAGVDVVLNSLSGQYQRASVRLLNDFGRFVEIGKRDVYEHTAIDQYDLRANCTFTVVDMSQVFVGDARSWAVLRDEVSSQVVAGHYPPIPHRTYRAVHAGQALRTMATGRHLGKILIAAQDPGVEAAEPRRRLRDYRDMAVIVTGGLTGLGFEIARAYVFADAGHVVLASRTPASSSKVSAVIDQLARCGRSRISFVQCDVSRLRDTEQLFVAVDRCAGDKALMIVHAAGVYRDEPIQRIGREHFLDVGLPKVLGALNLHWASRGRMVDGFCFVSSVSAMLGNAGQGSYAMANAFLDQLAEARKSRGLAASSINLGPLADVGFLADKPKVRSIINRQGTNFVPLRFAIKALQNITVMGLTRVGVFDMDWRLWREQMPFAEVPGKLAHVIGTQSGVQSGAQARIDIRKALERVVAADRLTVIERYIGDVVAAILAIEANSVDPTVNLSSHGLDSLSSVEMGLTIERDFGLSIPPEEIGDVRSVRAIAKFLLVKYDAAREAAG